MHSQPIYVNLKTKRNYWNNTKHEIHQSGNRFFEFVVLTEIGPQEQYEAGTCANLIETDRLALLASVIAFAFLWNASQGSFFWAWIFKWNEL